MVDSIRVDINQIAWDSKSSGMRVKRSQRHGHQIRMVDIGLDSGEPDCCEEGHVGYIVEGAQGTEIGGQTVRLNAGDGLMIIPSGREYHHRSKAGGGTVRLILIDDV